jgi:hypothetical protein
MDVRGAIGSHTMIGDVASAGEPSILGKVRPKSLGHRPVVPLLVPADLKGLELLDADAVLKSDPKVGNQIGVPRRVCGRPGRGCHCHVPVTVDDRHHRVLPIFADLTPTDVRITTGRPFQRSALDAAAGLSATCLRMRSTGLGTYTPSKLLSAIRFTSRPLDVRTPPASI